MTIYWKTRRGRPAIRDITRDCSLGLAPEKHSLRLGTSANPVSSYSSTAATLPDLLPSVITSVVHDSAAPVAHYSAAIDTPRCIANSLCGVTAGGIAMLGAATRGWAISGLVGQRGALSGDGLETWLQVFDEELGPVPGEGELSVVYASSAPGAG